MDNNLDWKDFQEISITLYEEFPDIDPQWISFPDLHSKICNLDNFIGDPKKSNEKICLLYTSDAADE